QSLISREQSRTWHPATAVLLADAPPGSVDANLGYSTRKPTTPVRARWQLPDGGTRLGKIEVGSGSRVGAKVPIWLNQAGEPAGERITAKDAAAIGFFAGAAVLIAGVAGAGGMFLLIRLPLNRSRSRAWQREWARVEP